MEWIKLLSNTRYTSEVNKEQVRSPYLRDIDKVTFSSYFRKLQDKTQVFPLSKSSYVRTRLTHSLEVCTVARSLGYMVGTILVDNYNLDNITAFDIAHILQAAALAHDIGNPPFGHKGEALISSFYSDWLSKGYDKNNELTPKEKSDLINFDGNAQGFRILNSLVSKNDYLGLGLTHATLGTFCKYPNFTCDESFISSKKIGVFASELAVFKNMVETLELPKIKNTQIVARHPLAFLLEAADDICYITADFQDAFFADILSFNEVEQSFLSFINNSEAENIIDSNYINKIHERYNNIAASHNKLEFLGSEVINLLIHAVSNAFLENQVSILAGTLNQPLLDLTKFKQKILNLRKKAKNKIYTAPEKSKQELKGMSAIKETLEICTNIVSALYNDYSNPQYIMINNLFLEGKLSNKQSLYENLQIINDFIVNSTDQGILDFCSSILKT